MARFPTIDGVTSGEAFRRNARLQVALMRWAESAGAEAADLVVTAVPIGPEWTSVRLTRVDDLGDPLDWLEWLAPEWLPTQAGVDHLAARECHGIMMRLRARKGLGASVAPGPLPEIPARTPAEGEGAREGSNAMPKKPRTAAERSDPQAPEKILKAAAKRSSPLTREKNAGAARTPAKPASKRRAAPAATPAAPALAPRPEARSAAAPPAAPAMQLSPGEPAPSPKPAATASRPRAAAKPRARRK